MIHLSKERQDMMKLIPRVPSNFLIDNGYEDSKTGRICFAASIDQALMALSKNVEGEILNVYKPLRKPTKTKKPSTKEVPDSRITGEIWVMEECMVEYVGSIKVGKAKNRPEKYTYGDGLEAELYPFKWKWVK